MNSVSATFKNATRAAVLALALGSGAVAIPAFVAPVMAQEPVFNFQLDLGNGNGSVQFGTQGNRGGDRGWDRPGRRYCLDDRQIRRGIANHGFRDVEIRRDLGRDRVEVRASQRRWTYSMRVNRCTGEVDRIEAQRPSRPGPGFGLHFNYGN